MKLSTFKENIKTNLPISIQVNKLLALSTTYCRLLFSGIFTAIILGLVICNTSAFFIADVPYGTLLYISSLLFCLLNGLIIGFKYTMPQKCNKWSQRLTILLLPIITMAMTECLNGVFIANWHPLAWAFNCIFYSLLYLFVFALTGRRNIPFIVISTLLYLISMANHYVLAYRGTPFLPSDLFYVSTAATVAGTYEFSLDYQVIISTVLFIFIVSVATKIKSPKQKLWKKIYYRVIAGLLAFVVLFSYFSSNVFVDSNFKPDFFNQERGYKKLGVAMNFFMNTRYLTTKEPEGYDAEQTEEIIYDLLKNNETSNITNKQPNVIVIMNETLADLNVLGEVNTNKDYMPFLRGLTENTVKGNLYVPVIGAGTSNTEFEFLTGVSTSFLPSGSNAFTLYVNHDLNSAIKTFENKGYSVTAFHPYYKNNWNRINAYNYLGFEKYFGIEDILNESIISFMRTGAETTALTQKIAEEYPGEEIIKRWYVSDSYNYKKVIEMYEEKDENKPFFMFNVTMQNHSSYADKHDNFNEEIYLTDENGEMRTEYPQTNQFLSLIYESDKAFKELIEYFKTQNEPTVICMFGDHQPKIENEFVAETLGADSIFNLTVEQEQARYCTPFYIWANYDIEEKEIDKLSVNYLSSYLMETIGTEMPVYNQYLLKLSETLPVINTIGYIDAEGNYYTYEDESEYKSLITNYEKVCYNHLLDEENCCDWLYELKE